MTLRCLAPLTLKFDGRPVQFEPGSIFTVTPAQGARVLAKFPAQVEVLTLPSKEPLQPGWLVVYRDQRGALCGGCDDRPHGTVATCQWDGQGWTVLLTDGQRLPLTRIRAVTQHDGTAWEVRGHGYTGTGPLALGGDPSAAPSPQLCITALRTVPEANMDWLTAYRALETLTSGIPAEDPRFARVVAALDQCDVAYHDGNREAFHWATAQVRKSLAEGDTHERP